MDAEIVALGKGLLGVRFAFDRAAVAAVRAIPGRRWNPTEGRWTVPNTPESRARLAEIFPESDDDGSLRARLLQELRIRRYSPRTIKAYRSHLTGFARHLGGRPGEATSEDVRAYLLALQARGVSAAYQNQAVSALRFFFIHVLRRELDPEAVPRPKRDRKLPAVLSGEEIRRLIAAIRNPKHRALLLVTYSAGLRVSEAVRLKLMDLDEDRRMIYVRGQYCPVKLR